MSIALAHVWSNGCVWPPADTDGQLVILSSAYVHMYNTSFTDISSPSISSTADPTSLPTVILLYESILDVSKCNFTGNSISAHASFIDVSGTVTFSNSTALVGPALVLIGCTMTLFTDGHMYFFNNHATNIGGVFYITHSTFAYDPNLQSIAVCFLSTLGHKTMFTFVNNTAGKGGDIFYGELLFGHDFFLECSCLYVFIQMSNILQSGLSLISSDPLQVCLCNNSGQPDFLLLMNPKLCSIYPGQTILQ